MLLSLEQRKGFIWHAVLKELMEEEEKKVDS